MELTLIVANKNLSSWSLRPWLLLTQAGIPFKEEMVYFGDPAWAQKVGSPSGKVPLLRLGSGPQAAQVWESLAICETVAELFPEKRLWPQDPLSRALARSVSNEMHGGFQDLRSECSMDVGLRVKKPLGKGALANAARIDALWTQCRAQHGKGGPFLFGAFSVADAMYAPVAYRLRSYGIEVSKAAQEYYTMLLELPAMRRWEADALAELQAGIDEPGHHGGPFSRAEVQEFVARWEAAWGRKDVEGILGHFGDGARLTGPGVQELTGGDRVEGRAALRGFFAKALSGGGPISYAVEASAWDAEARTLTLRYRSGPAGGPAHRACAVLRFGADRRVAEADVYAV
jgi:glutathione S-transferase